ncbi:FmdB family zinc ribbon protein [Calycomorphotria hydatis]|uniref:DUF4190 domain-containing protein n=1 Tax=Calycomorphotria hydatis TaxID=2528027 RepID=A0A517TCS3_9PLAN|nr:hypothetical protein [Calycomorphotria hydatis]QDT66180.1 hypothetical protein V22_34450 [Calycomorphotria hydatis]
MTIEFRCDHCDKLLRTSADRAGLSADCPACGTPVTVPESDRDYSDHDFEVHDYEQEDPWRESSVSQPEHVSTSNRPLESHRGIAVLLLAIFSWVIGPPIPAIIAVMLARTDLRAMDEGRMDPSGRGMTQAGYWIAWVHIILSLLTLVLICGGFLVAIAAANA